MPLKTCFTIDQCIRFFFRVCLAGRLTDLTLGNFCEHGHRGGASGEEDHGAGLLVLLYPR